MPNKIIICNNHIDEKICQYTLKMIKKMQEKNENITILLEGVSREFLDLDKASKIDFVNKNIYPSYAILMKEVIESRATIIPIEKNVFDKCDNAEDEQINNFHDFVEKEIEVKLNIATDKYELHEYTQEDKLRDEHMFRIFNEFEGDCVLIIGSAHPLKWLQQGLIQPDEVNVLFPNHDNDVKNAFELWCQNIEYNEEIGQKIHNDIQETIVNLGAEYIDLNNFEC